MQTASKRALAVAALVALAWACGADGMRGAGSVFEDAGQLLVDAGSALVDGGTAIGDAAGGDAEAAPVTMEAPCSVERTMTRESSSSTTQQWYWYAEFSMPDLVASEVARISAFSCGGEKWQEPATAPGGCPEGSTCTGDNPVPLAGLACHSTLAQFEDGVVRVLCGTRTRTVSETSTLDLGTRAEFVRISVATR